MNVVFLSICVSSLLLASVHQAIACTQGWDEFLNLHGWGGTGKSHSTEAACKSACAADNNCAGVDIDTVGSTLCWFLTASALEWGIGDAPGVNHYRKSLTSCHADCISVWEKTANKHVYGGSGRPGYTNEEDCKKSCAADATCFGVDFDDDVYTKCWFLSQAVVNSYLYDNTGVNHYKLAKRCNAATCGSPAIAPVINRIVGGEEAVAHSWPWQINLLRPDGSHWCGGSVIGKRKILTAAHCLTRYGGTNMRVRTGDHLNNANDGTEQTFDVVQATSHASYNAGSHDYDIAILTVDADINYNNNVEPVCIGSDAIPDGTDCVTTGWGATEGTGDANRLNQVTVPIVSTATCNQWNWYNNRITSRMICAGYAAGVRDSCQGDSGGPLVCLVGGRWVLHGLTSWGAGCAEPNKPGIYTRVSFFTDWINQNAGTLY